MNDNKAGIEHNPNDNEQGFFQHLEELRGRLFKAVLAVLVGCVGAGYFVNDIMNLILLKPAVTSKLELQNLRPFGQQFLYVKVILVSGVVVAFPFVMYQLWKFIEPGLYAHERRWAGRITALTTICFMLGVSFAYFVMIPGMLQFTVSFGTANIKNIIDIGEYFSFMIMTILGAGLIFELPMITFVLSSIGLVTSAMMRKYRRHAIVVILFIAAIITPSPDPINQLIFACPLYILYEISIVIARLTRKQAPKEKTA
ncbi:MAG: twin-arginine translocase subunit TatC [Ignavibacteria bacterium]|nr:twin-arginine translocase subunit TatC [Ignavibacteria bacterium]MBL7991334.1 twin-arginine translocase subunit TatC [Candidatus Kapabacteria bacterium]